MMRKKIESVEHIRLFKMLCNAQKKAWAMKDFNLRYAIIAEVLGQQIRNLKTLKIDI